ncbi:spore coat protein [Paenibacillus sp. GCM10027628]|uniref:spore coat protein n=1 Tax=Paenibacillus sp. GCM10027628 TaxID=3273413 RepID=UPI0036346A1B
MTVELAMPQSGQLPQVKGPEMNDRDFINEILTHEKYLSASYNTGLLEMQNPKLHTTVQSILSDTHNSQFQIFDQMFQKGWYKMKVADQQEIQQVKTQFTNYQTQFPKFQ